MICIAIGTGFLAIAAVLILVFRNSLGYLFVDSADVAAVVASICPIAAMYQIPDGVLGTIGGVLRCIPKCQPKYRSMRGLRHITSSMLLLALRGISGNGERTME